MSAEARNGIAEAANTVEGLNVTPYSRQSLIPGAGSVRMIQRARSDNNFGWVDTYQVLVTLSQDVKTAETWIDDHVAEVCAALDRELHITNVALIQLPTESNPVNAVVFEGTRGESA